MKNTIILFCLLINIAVQAQNEFGIYCSGAQVCINKNQYYQAFKIMQTVKGNWAKTKSQQDTVDLYIVSCIDGINKLLATAILEKAKSDSLLFVANSIQRRVETSIFDKAVKERIKEWKGYENFLKLDGEGKNEILKKIDTLDLSNYSLSRLPHEVKDCPNLKSLNLLKNNFEVWDSTFFFLSQLRQLGDLKITISPSGFNNLKPEDQRMITGLEIFSKDLNQVPENILQQKQLNYLDLSYCHIPSLPAEIKNMINLTSLDLSNNELDSLPAEIGKLTNLTSLDLNNNQLTSLPAEIAKLSNLTGLDLSNNQLT